MDERPARWEYFTLVGICSKSVRIEVVDTYSKSRNGFVEVQVLAERTDGAKFRTYNSIPVKYMPQHHSKASNIYLFEYVQELRNVS